MPVNVESCSLRETAASCYRSKTV